MSVARLLPLLAVALLVAAPAAEAYAQPVFYFLKDAPSPLDQVPDVPSPIPLPIAVPTIDPNAGILDPYDPKMPNAPNGTTGKSRMVVAGQDLVLPVQFLTPDGHTHANRLKGPIFVGLWTGESATYLANLTVTLYEVPAEGTPIALANASLNLDFNQSNTPDPMTFIPENQTDPQAIAFYELAQVLPLLYHAPALFQIGPVDVMVSNESKFALGFALTQGASPVPLPAGLSATIQYDGAVTPSFVYAPWYAPDPPKASPTPRPTVSRSSSSGAIRSQSQSGSGSSDDQDSPGFALPVSLVALMAVAAFAARRRTR
ncbi:MAG: hypothetical protein QOC71_1402 [Thermoplasmata archaeon]|nr:hypothetical protein [Thermoplasmata archaeon]